MPTAAYTPLTVTDIQRQLSEWRGSRPGFHLLALLPEAEKERLRMLQDVCRDAGIELAGALFPRLIHDGRFVESGALLLCIDNAPPPLLLTEIDNEDGPRRTAYRIDKHLAQHLSDEQDAAVFCIFDAMVPNIASHLDKWYLKLANRVSYFGANAGNERFAPEPCLFDSRSIVANAVLVQILPGHPGAMLQHGYRTPETLTLATSTSGNRIENIDCQPAMEAYNQILQQEYNEPLDADNFYQQAVHFPFGIVRADGEVLVRIPVAVDEQSILCVGEIPQNAALTLLDARDCERRAVPALTASLAARSSQPQDLLLFYCAGRRMHMGDKAEAELASILHSREVNAVTGALSLGEIGTSQFGSYPLFHNATLVGIPWTVT